VGIEAEPDAGKRALGRLARSEDPDLRWIVRENLGKARLARLDAAWVGVLAGGAAWPEGRAWRG
jgi:hypothetical protein